MAVKIFGELEIFENTMLAVTVFPPATHTHTFFFVNLFFFFFVCNRNEQRSIDNGCAQYFIQYSKSQLLPESIVFMCHALYYDCHPSLTAFLGNPPQGHQDTGR